MDNDASPLADTEVHYLESEHVGDEFKIFIGHCGTRAGAGAGVDAGDPVPTLYLIDANGFFGSAVEIIRSLQLAAHLPPILVVGIGYRAGVLFETVTQRTRDLTPSSDTGFARIFPDLATMGGAAAMLGFIREELMPWVGDRFPADPDNATVFGHSLGGLFATYVLLSTPATFARYAIGSPSYWWDKGWIRSYEAAYAAGHDDLAAKVFFGIGADETFAGRKREAVNYPPELREQATAWPFDMVADLTNLVAAIEARGYPSLQLTSAVFPGEFHVTVPPLILSRAVRTLFDAPR